MGKYAHLLGGAAAIGAGVWMIRATWPLCWHAILAVVPLVLVLGGGLAIVIGLAEIADHFGPKPPANPPGTAP